jgi:hypothetical protein
MIRTSTVVYIVILLVLVGAYYYLNNREQAADIELTVEPTEEVSYLFPAEEGTLSSIRIESKTGDIVELTRGADDAWVLNQPSEGPADPGAAEAAASQITAMPIEDTVPDVDPKIVGLDIPEYILTVNFTSGGERTVEVGVITPTENGYYVRDASDKIVIVGRSAIDALLGLLANPPYLETPTPLPASSTSETDALPSETATP